SPATRVCDRPREILVDERRDVLDRLPPAHGERPANVRRPTRHLRVHASDAEMVEEPGPDVAEALSGGRRYRKRGIAQSENLEKRHQLRVGIGETARLVGEKKGRKSQGEGVVTVCGSDVRGVSVLPAFGKRDAPLA